MVDDVRKTVTAAVVGAGLMGAGIAQVLARAGHEVRLYDQRPGVAVQQVAAAGYSNLMRSSSIGEAVEGCDLVIEAIPELLDAKTSLLRALASMCPHAVVASNSSSFGPTALSPYAADPSRLLVAHFFNPATVVPLVELVPSEETDPSVLDWVADLLASAGKTVVKLRRDVPGFVANRLQAAILREALNLVDMCVVEPAELDLIVTSSIGTRWSLAGPLRIADLGGLDVFAALSARIFPDLDGAERATALEDLVSKGRLGAKVGRGLYNPAEPPSEDYVAGLITRFS